MTDMKDFKLSTKANISYTNVSSVGKPAKIAIANEKIATEYTDVDHARGK